MTAAARRVAAQAATLIACAMRDPAMTALLIVLAFGPLVTLWWFKP